MSEGGVAGNCLLILPHRRAFSLTTLPGAGRGRELNPALCYQGGWCPGEAWGPGGSSAAQARVGKGPRCTPYAVPVPASSARSDRPIPHRSPGIKHPLTNAGPSLKRTRTPSCTNHSDDRARAHWPTAPRAVGKRRGDDRRGLGRQPNDQHRAVPPLIHRAPETPRR